MQEPSALGRIVQLVRDLRRRCPWDAAQTPATLRPYLVEEVLELDHAIGEGDPSAVRDELGDLLLHLAFQIVLGEETGAFGTEDVTRAIEQKMHRRHPHLFDLGNQPVSWERSKLADGERAGVLDGLPPTLPALIMAVRLQERAAGVGFDWPDAAGPRGKVREELNELEAEIDAPAPSRARVAAEVGDLLFAVVNLSRKLGCDPRAALEQANRRFQDRFKQVEALAAERGIDVGTAGLEQLDRLWEEAKTAVRGEK